MSRKMLRIVPIKSTTKRLSIQQLIQQRSYAKPALSINIDLPPSSPVSNEREPMTRNEVKDMINIRFAMNDELRKMCNNICTVKKLDKNEITSAIAKIEQWTTLMYKELGMKHPFSDVILHCLINELALSSVLYQHYIKSEEFLSLVSNSEDPRPHMFSPGAALLVKQLEAAPLKANPEKRLELLVDFFNAYYANNFIDQPLLSLFKYLAQKEDCKVIFDLSSKLSDKNKHFLASVIHEIFHWNRMDRLKELMDCELKTESDIRLFTNRVTGHLVRKLKSIKLDSPASVAELKTIVQVIGAGLKSNHTDTTGNQALATIFSSSAINDDVLKRIVDDLMADSQVLVSKAGINRIETQLRDSNLPSRAKLISRLRQKNSTYQRWIKNDNLADLIDEAKTLEKRGDDLKPEVLCALYNVIMKKATATQPIDINALAWVLPAFYLREKKLSLNDAKIYRSDFSNSLSTAVNYALLNQDFDVFDKLWELRPFKAYCSDHIILFALSYFERGLHEKADGILSSLKDSAIAIDEKTLNLIVTSDYMHNTFTSEKVITDFVQLLAQHFGISIDWESRLISVVQLNGLHKLIHEGKLNEVNEKIAQMGEHFIKDPTTSFVLIDLLKASIRSNDSQAFMKTKEFIDTRADPYTLVLYVGLSFLELNDERYVKMLNKIKHIPTDVLRTLIRRETKEKRADVLHTLFNIMNKPEASSLELETLLEETIKAYYENKDLDNLRILYGDVRNSSFYLSAKLKIKIENNIKMLERQSNNDERITPKSTSPTENSQPLK